METNLKLKDILNTFNFAYEKLNSTLYNHNKEVAYLTLDICNALFINNEIKCNLILAAYLHNVTLFNSNYDNYLNNFNDISPSEHSILSYVFIETLIPSNNFSKYILYHNSKFSSANSINNISIPDESNILKIANDIALLKLLNKNLTVTTVINFLNKNIDSYNPKYIKVLFSTEGYNIINNLLNNTFTKKLSNYNLNITSLNLLELINTIAFLIDFKCDITNIHSIAVSQCSVLLCNEFDLTSLETEEVLIGSLLHDIGKLVTPDSILKNPGKLTYSEYSIMKYHVNYTYEILKNLNNEKILNIASNHHEKLNGTGYPKGISMLSLQERIVAVADIFVALSQKRIYKDSFTKEKTIEILLNAVNENEIDDIIVNKLIKNYDYFIIKNIELSLKYDHLLEKLNTLYIKLSEP